MRVCILGSAAGGGFPQWNCHCPNCRGVREGSLRARARTQSSIALSEDGKNWLLINASPDILKQLADQPLLHPRAGLRDTPIQGVLLMDAQVDHVAGLLMLREGCPLPLYCTKEVFGDLSTRLPLLETLKHWNGGFTYNEIPEGGDGFQVRGFPSLRFQRVPLVSNAPPYSARRGCPAPGDNIGLFVTDARDGRSLLYAPGLGVPTPETTDFMRRADTLMVDGTFWTDDEMSVAGLGERKASEMGHLPVSGDQGILALLQPMRASRKVLIHINNTNPILNEDSEERGEVQAQGVIVAHDGMQFDV